MQPVHFMVETLPVQGSLRSENRHGVIDVAFFFGGNGSKSLA
jgi:hypothetical protein